MFAVICPWYFTVTGTLFFFNHVQGGDEEWWVNGASKIGRSATATSTRDGQFARKSRKQFLCVPSTPSAYVVEHRRGKSCLLYRLWDNLCGHDPDTSLDKIGFAETDTRSMTICHYHSARCLPLRRPTSPAVPPASPLGRDLFQRWVRPSARGVLMFPAFHRVSGFYSYLH